MFVDDSLPLFACRPHGTPSAGPRVLRSLEPGRQALLLTNSISPLPLHKVWVLLDWLDRQTGERHQRHERLALVHSISNLHFGPEVGNVDLDVALTVIAHAGAAGSGP